MAQTGSALTIREEAERGKVRRQGRTRCRRRKKVTCSQPRYVSVYECDIPVAEMTVTNGLDRRRTF